MKAEPMQILGQEKRARISTVLCALALLIAGTAGCSRASQDLTVWVTDPDGNPVPGAMVGLSENGQTLLTDQEGQVTWEELGETQASLVVVAQGYVLQTTVVSLERGMNETTLKLTRKQHTVPYQPPVSP